MSGGNATDWMKPSLDGTIADTSDDSSVLTYRIDARGTLMASGLALFALIGICVAVGLALSGMGMAALASAGLAIFLAGGTLILLGQADQGVREETLLLSWISDAYGRLE
jgi:hypothetical protein